MSKRNSDSDVITGLEREFQRLFFPPNTMPTAGIQKNVGNQYPTVESYNLSDHFNGTHTYAFDLPFELAGVKMTRLGVLDIDEGLESLPKVRQIQDYASSRLGLKVYVAFSGSKGFHVYLPSEPIRIEYMHLVLENIQRAVPFKGDLIPAKGVNRVKVAPCFHQEARQVSYLLTANEPLKIMPSRQELHDILPDQLAIMEGIRPNLAAHIMALADYFKSEDAKTDSTKLIPDLKKLGGELPPCMLKFREMGGAVAIGRYDGNNLTLRTYCNSAGIPDSKADELAGWLADNTNPDIDTTKDTTAKLRHWESTRDTPAAQEPFSCAFLLRAKKELRFDCAACRVAPEGIKHRSSKHKTSEEPFNPKLKLPLNMSRRLLAYLLQSGANVSDIADDVFMDPTDKAVVHAFLNGCRDVADIFRFWDSQPEKDRNLYFSS
ncbi:hypothetical protein SAMN06295888_1445 [Desulfonatronum zhilinae]|nr:hypothetical protein SAMN06295888_1445 [Desulfonatronum zhilinae]